MSAVLAEHFGYLTDTNKLAAYAAAFSQTLTANDVVLDLGCGTGLLGMLACRSGARRVYAIDRGGILDTARLTAAENGFTNRIKHVRGLSLDVTLPEPVSLVVSDQLDPMGFEAGVFQFTADAKRRLATRDARFVPSSVATVVAPVEHSQHDGLVARWSREFGGMSFSAFRNHAANSTYAVKADSSRLLAPGVSLWEVPLGAPEAFWSRLDGKAAWTIQEPGELNGLLGWFAANMVGDLVFTSDPTAPQRINRLCRYLPFDSAVKVQEGDSVVATVHAVPGSGLINWRAVVTRNGTEIVRWSQSTLVGSFSLAEDMAAARRSAKPCLSPIGQAKAALLASCDGRRDLPALADILRERFPQLWHSTDAALSFVRQTLRELRSDFS